MCGIVYEWLALPLAAATRPWQRTSVFNLLSSGTLARQGTRPRYPNRDNDVRGAAGELLRHIAGSKAIEGRV